MGVKLFWYSVAISSLPQRAIKTLPDIVQYLILPSEMTHISNIGTSRKDISKVFHKDMSFSFGSLGVLVPTN